MYRSFRVLHRWAGLLGSLFLVLIAVTGFLLALKRRFVWIQPPTAQGTLANDFSNAAPLDAITGAALRLGLPELQGPEDIGRMELHSDRGIYKLISERGFHEVQVDAVTAKVLSVGRRNDQLIEAIHDLSFFSPWVRDWVLPIVALVLLGLGLTGIYLFFTPIYRRWVHHRTKSPRPR